MLSFSPVARSPSLALRSRILGPPLTPLASSACFLCHSLFRLAMYPPKEPPGFLPFPETVLPRSPLPLAHLQRGCILFLSERRSLSAPFRSSLASDTSPPPHLPPSEELLSFSHLLSPLPLSSLFSPGEYIATAPEAVARILSTRGTLRHATLRHATPRHAVPRYTPLSTERKRDREEDASPRLHSTTPWKTRKIAATRARVAGPETRPKRHRVEQREGREGWKN